MRTTGIRSAPVPAPRPKQPPQPLPRTKFLQKATSEEPPDAAPSDTPSPAASNSSPDAPLRPPPDPPSQGTLAVISQSLAAPANTKKKTPPPKPPRSPIVDNPAPEDAPVNRRPGLMEVLSRPSPSPPSSPARSQPAAATQGQGRGLGAVPTRRAPRPRVPPLLLPPPPATVPPRPPPGTAPPRLPLRPSPAQLESSRARVGAREPRPAGPRSVPESPVCSVEDFEDCCKEVFRNTRTAKDLASRGKHVQAASHYQVALTALDRVLRAQVLTLTNHEMTRQRLFLLQQDVFSLRKEALHGFTDSQTAVRSVRGVSPTRATPGAPPSYDEVLNEDRRRQRDEPQVSSRQPSSQGAAAAASTSSQHSPQGNPTPRLRPHPQTNPTSTQHPARRPHSTIDARIEELADVFNQTTTPSTSATSTTVSATRHASALRRSSRASTTRPKSSYHPPKDQPLSLPPPLVPVSVAPSFPSLQPQPSVPSIPPLPDEVLQSQRKALQVFESADGTVSHKGEPPSLSTMPENLQEGKKGDVTGAGEGEEMHEAQKTSSLESSVDPVNDLSSAEAKVTEEGGEAKRTVPISSASSIDDPFLSLDPFPPVESKPEDSDGVFCEGSAACDIPSTDTDTQHSYESVPPNAAQRKGSQTPTVTQSPPDNLGDSILEALDFAVTPAHKKVSPQASRGRSYSEENLLDSSHNTLEALLNYNKDVYSSRASIIEEFDPLSGSHTLGSQDEMRDEESNHQDEVEAGGVDVPKPVPRRRVYGSNSATRGREQEEGSMYDSSPPDYYAEEGAMALEEVAEDDYYYCHAKMDPVPEYLPDGARGRASYSSDDSGMLSWPSDLSARTPSTPALPIYPRLYPEEDQEEEDKGVDVGRSAFYLPPSNQSDGSRRRDLLRIREGVKIYFIYTDGVITSPYKRPFLAVFRDSSKADMVGEGLVLSVGNSLWACELRKKATLVLRTQAGGYMFSEVAGKPECKAVCVRVPSNVRKTQQELLSKILLQNTLLEDERPKGITKAISTSALSAATRMNKLVENSSMDPSQPFVRRNSVRALKGVSKRLNTIAEKTGATMKELPREYQALQEAADTLSLARNAKMIQYI